MVRRLIFRNIKSILYLFGLTILLIILTNPLVSAVVYSLIIDKNSIIIFLPSPAEVFNRSLSSIRRVSYYVEIWAVAPEGIVEVLKTKAGPDNFMIKLTAREMMKIVSKWLDFYRSNGKFWRPAVIIQFSTYDPDENISILAFGASVTYDPEIFVSPMPRSEIHILSIDRFPMIKKFVIERKEGSGFSFSSCDISFQGLPNPCQSPGDCNCCVGDGFVYFTRLVLGQKLFDSSDPSIPSTLRDKVPLLILHLDPNAQTEYFVATYKAKNVNKWIFRMTIFDRSLEKVIWGDASGELTSTVGSAIAVDTSKRIGIIYWPGSFKLYTAYGYLCCYEKLCTGSGDIAITCDSNDFSALLMIVTYVGPGVYGIRLTSDEAPLDISYFRSKLEFTRYYMSGGSYISIQRDLYELRINVVNIFMAIILSKLGVPWWLDASLSIAAEKMPIAVEIVGSGGMEETLEIYNPGQSPVTVYISKIRAVYRDPILPQSVYTPLLIDVR